MREFLSLIDSLAKEFHSISQKSQPNGEFRMLLENDDPAKQIRNKYQIFLSDKFAILFSH